MTVSQRLRFEILRRDNHACRYCGGRAPDVALTVDHVVPVTLGGTDDASNLVTACGPCNSGKTSTVPDAPLVADVAKDHELWRSLLRAARFDGADGYDNEVVEFDRRWHSWTPIQPRTPNWPKTIAGYLDAGVDIDDLLGYIPTAMQRPGVDDRWRYFCGCARNRIAELHEKADEIRRGVRRLPCGSEITVTRPDGTEVYALHALDGLIEVAGGQGPFGWVQIAAAKSGGLLLSTFDDVTVIPQATSSIDVVLVEDHEDISMRTLMQAVTQLRSEHLPEPTPLGDLLPSPREQDG